MMISNRIHPFFWTDFFQVHNAELSPVGKRTVCYLVLVLFCDDLCNVFECMNVWIYVCMLCVCCENRQVYSYCCIMKSTFFCQTLYELLVDQRFCSWYVKVDKVIVIVVLWKAHFSIERRVNYWRTSLALVSSSNESWSRAYMQCTACRCYV